MDFPNVPNRVFWAGPNDHLCEEATFVPQAQSVAASDACYQYPSLPGNSSIRLLMCPSNIQGTKTRRYTKTAEQPEKPRKREQQMGALATAPPTQFIVEPVWDIAFLFPEQGQWGEEEYLALTTNHLVEYSHGLLEVLPMPTCAHQRLVAFLYRLLAAFVEAHGLGEIFFAPYRVQLWPGKYREPDLVFLNHEPRYAIDGGLHGGR